MKDSLLDKTLVEKGGQVYFGKPLFIIRKGVSEAVIISRDIGRVKGIHVKDSKKFYEQQLLTEIDTSSDSKDTLDSRKGKESIKREGLIPLKNKQDLESTSKIVRKREEQKKDIETQTKRQRYHLKNRNQFKSIVM